MPAREKVAMWSAILLISSGPSGPAQYVFEVAALDGHQGAALIDDAQLAKQDAQFIGFRPCNIAYNRLDLLPFGFDDVVPGNLDQTGGI